VTVLLQAGDTRLAVHDPGGPGLPLLPLHGLAGYGGEWSTICAALGNGFRPVQVDQRGHGASERRPTDLTQGAFVADAAAVIRSLSAGPVVLIGQSLGGLTALLTAAAPFDPAVIVATMGAAVGLDAWPAWDSLTCPVLVVLGSEGIVPATDALRMTDSASALPPRPRRGW
jgi:pimeloyl-ACP methyl ester carboxylesterase